MATMQGITREVDAQRHTLALTRQKLTTTARLDTLRAHVDVTSARMWGFTTLYMIDAAYGADTAERIRAAHRAVPNDVTALRAFWASVLPMGDALPFCDACEDDHPSVPLADGSVVCAREGADR